MPRSARASVARVWYIQRCAHTPLTILIFPFLTLFFLGTHEDVWPHAALGTHDGHSTMKQGRGVPPPRYLRYLDPR